MKRLISVLSILSALLFALPAYAQIIIGGGGGGGGSVSLTTTGTSGAASLTGGILNIPVYQGQISLTTTGTGGGATFGSNTLNIPQYQCALTLSTTGTSGAATLSGCTLNIPQYSGGGGGSLPSGVNGQVVVNNGSSATAYSAASPVIGVANGGAVITSSYTMLCDSATVSVGIQDRGKWAIIGTSGSLTIPDFSTTVGNACYGFYGGVMNSTSSSITVSRQTSDTFTVYGPVQGTPSTANTTFTLPSGAWATFDPSGSSTVYNVRIYGPPSSGTGTVIDGAGTGTASQIAVSNGTAHNITYAATSAATVAALTVADTTVAVSSGTQGANSCSTPTTVTMTGLTTSMVVVYNYSADPGTLIGWGSTGGMAFHMWPSASNTASWEVCNQTGTSITYGAITFNAGAR